MTSPSDDVKLADELFESYSLLTKEIGKIVYGQDDVIRHVLTSIFCDGHSLLVGVPGLAKTLLVQTISKCLGLDFNRIQFTPDLMPSDILGSETLDRDKNFKFIPGPIFSNIILADEINRTPPKTQSALLEAMQEYSVTVAGVAHNLDRPFFVLATQNPIEQEGTYPLPEAQLDRFMFMIKLEYPDFNTELEIVKATTSGVRQEVEVILDKERIRAYQQLIRRVPVTDNVFEYIVQLVQKTRPNTDQAHQVTNEYLEWGAGPRAAQNLAMAAKCVALLNNKYSPDIEDVQSIAVPVLRHRVFLNFKAEANQVTIEQLIQQML